MEKIKIQLSICPKCKTENQADFQFCKVCKHPLFKHEGDLKIDKKIFTDKTKVSDPDLESDFFLEIQWIENSSQQKIESKVKLIDFEPYFKGYAKWENYAFFIYPCLNNYELMVRKIVKKKESSLYRKCNDYTFLKDESTFNLGQLVFKFTEESNLNEKTILVGPGSVAAQSDNHTRGLKILNIKSESDFQEISKKTQIGRDWFAKHFGLDSEMLRTSGISRDHLAITPLKYRMWLIEPFTSKIIFTAIDETPVLLNHGEVLRWIEGSKYSEFKIKINAGKS